MPPKIIEIICTTGHTQVNQQTDTIKLLKPQSDKSPISVRAEFVKC